MGSRLRRTAVMCMVGLTLPLVAAGPARADALPSGERQRGRSAIEPAYNADTGKILYLGTPEKSPFPHAHQPARGLALVPGRVPAGVDGRDPELHGRAR